MSGRILIIRGGAIGDFILTLPALRLVRENFPAAHIELLGYRHIVALAEGRHYADAARSIEYAGLARFFIPGAELDPELVAYFKSFAQIVSYLFDPDGFFEANLRRCGVKNYIHGSPKLDDSAHAAIQLAAPMQSLALYIEDHAATVHPSAADAEFAASFLEKAATPVIALHPGSGGVRKNWPLEQWRALGEWLTNRPGDVSLLLVGGEADFDTLSALERAWPRERLLVARSLPLPHLAAVLARCALFLGHDSGISHLAAAAGTRCVLLFGPTDPDIWAPTNPGVTILRARDGWMENLPLTEVQAAALARLGAE